MISFKKLKWFFDFLRIFDYIICLILGLGGWLIGSFVRPHCRPFSWYDITISLPYGGKGTFPSWTLALIAILPGIFYIIVEAIRTARMRHNDLPGPRVHSALRIAGEDEMRNANGESTQRVRMRTEGGTENTLTDSRNEQIENFDGSTRWWIFVENSNHWVLAQAFSVTLTLFIVDITKIYAGRLRPDFLERLEMDGFTPSSVNVDWCSIAREGRLSFPSGHSGISFAAIAPMVFYCMGLLQAFEGHSLWRAVLSLIPLILPFTVAVSRTLDNRHHFSDILGGSLIGVFSGIFSVMLLFRITDLTGSLLPRRMEYASKRGFRVLSDVVV